MRTLALTLFASIFVAGCFGSTIRPGQRGVKYSAFGGLQHDVRGEGFYFRWPWNGFVRYDVTWQSKTEEVEILSADALHVRTRVTVTYRPRADEIYELATQIGPTYYDEIIRPAFLTITRGEFASHAHNALAVEGGEIEARVLARLRKAVKGKPLEIDRVSIDHIDFDKTVTGAIASKVSAQQMIGQKENELEVAKRDADIARTLAAGRADAVRIEAQGEADAMIARGDAQAKAQKAITKTLTTKYLSYKAFDNPATRYYFVPVGKNGLPILIDAPE